MEFWLAVLRESIGAIFGLAILAMIYSLGRSWLPKFLDAFRSHNAAQERQADAIELAAARWEQSLEIQQSTQIAVRALSGQMDSHSRQLTETSEQIDEQSRQLTEVVELLKGRGGRG